MSSSRSITAARARRAGEQAPPMSGTRPGTSIGSHAAFAPQQQYQQPSANVRLARGQPPQMQQQTQTQQPQQTQMQQQQPSNGLPFTKLSISDAIGLITLRLGRVEQFIIDVENGEQGIGGLSQSSSSFIPENSKIVDSSVINNIVSRIDSLEKREATPNNNNEQFSIINDEIAGIRLQVNKLNEEFIKSNLLLSNHTEQIFRFNRTLTETKDLLQNLIMKVDTHIQETNDKFVDYEYALTEIEKNVQNSVNENGLDSVNIGFSLQENKDKDNHQEDIDQDQEEQQDNSAILSVDLKNIIKQELANV